MSTAVLASTPVSPGGTAQITLTLASPLAIVTGNLSLDLDPAVFDDISAINVFGAIGDQVGVANIHGRHADVQFTSNAGGIGRLPNYPVLQITVPVLATAKPGVAGVVTALSKLPWRDLPGNQYTMSFRSAGIVIGNGISISSVVPGGGPVPAGTQVQINGQGFTAATTLQIEGVAFSNPQFVNSGQLRFVLPGPADLTGKLVTLTGAGAQARYYSWLTPTTIRRAASVEASIQPIFSQVLYSRTVFGFGPFALENPAVSPVDVVFENIGIPIRNMPPPVTTTTVTIPAGSVFIGDSGDLPHGEGSIIPTVPIRALVLSSAQSSVTGFIASPATPIRAFGASPGGPLTWDLQASDQQPSSVIVSIYPVNSPAPVSFDVAAGTEDGKGWLAASLVPGYPAQFSVSVDPAGLALGTHQGVITITPRDTFFPPLQLSATLNIHVEPTIVSKITSLGFTLPTTVPQSIAIASGSGAVPITASSSVSWLSVTPTSASTPATLTISPVIAALPIGQNGFLSGIITVRGPGNTLTIPVLVEQPTGPANPMALTFSTAAGSSDPMTHRVNVGPTIQPITFDATTESGGPWLSAVITDGPGVPGLAVSINASHLGPGTYRGAVTIHPINQLTRTDPISVAVNLFVWTSATPAPVASPASLQFTARSGSGVLQNLTLSTGSLPLPFAFQAVTDDGSNWLGVQGLQDTQDPHYTPSTIFVNVYSSGLFPGVYHGSVIVTSPPGSTNTVTIPVTFTVTPAAPPTGGVPLISALVNAASLLPGPIAPGEIVTVFGMIGPDNTSGVNIGRDGKLNTASFGNRVLFNGIPAPLIYMSPTQINAVVPYEIANSPMASVELDMSGSHSSAWTVPVTSSAPGVFTQTGTGQGSAAILNQDNSPNSPTLPAVRGSIVQIFATGEGQTTPPGVTGAITKTDVKTPALAASVQIAGVDATIVSATTAPDAIAGLLQINARIPQTAPVGSMPVVVRIGSAASQTTAIISVQ